VKNGTVVDADPCWGEMGAERILNDMGVEREKRRSIIRRTALPGESASPSQILGIELILYAPNA
jgi:hypothetical protein